MRWAAVSGGVGSPRVLVAEDDDVNRRMLVRALGKWGYEPVEAADGAEALRVVRGDAPPALAIVDWMMPEADGLEVCRALRARPDGDRYRVLLLTAKASGEDATRAFDAGADDYVRKPYALDELRARLGVLARGKAQNDTGAVAPTPVAPLAEGSLVAGRWVLEGVIGRGGMGTVWRARHATLGTHAALKILRSELVQNEIVRKRFEAEALAASRLGSRHIARALDYGWVGGGPGSSGGAHSAGPGSPGGAAGSGGAGSGGAVAGGGAGAGDGDGRAAGDAPFIAMELLSGYTLAAALADRGPLPHCEARILLRQVAQGLARAHEAGLLHRDLKTENVFLAGVSEDSPDGLPYEAKILDFGIAKDLRSTRSVTESGMVVGTLEAMAPEQLLGEEELTPAADVWAFGVLAFETLTGVSPFAAGSVGATTLRICEGRAPVPSSVDDLLPPAFDAWFATACARDPRERFLTIRDAANALDAALATPDCGPQRLSMVLAASGARVGLPTPAGGAVAGPPSAGPAGAGPVAGAGDRVGVPHAPAFGGAGIARLRRDALVALGGAAAGAALVAALAALIR